VSVIVVWLYTARPMLYSRLCMATAWNGTRYKTFIGEVDRPNGIRETGSMEGKGRKKWPPLATCACQTWLQDRRPQTVIKPNYDNLCIYSHHRQSRVLRSYVRPTVNTVFIDKRCCSSVLMLRSHRLEKFSIICISTADSFTSFRSRLKT